MNCTLSECAGKPKCERCVRLENMEAMCSLLPEGASWGDPLTPELLQEILGNANAGDCQVKPEQSPVDLSRLLRKMKSKRSVFQAGRDSYKTSCVAMNTDDEAWEDYLRAQG